jgi:hypothetical protein
MPGSVSVAIGDIVANVREGLLAMAVGTGLQVLVAMMDADVAAVVGGPKGKHDPNRTAVRHGTERGSVTLGGVGCPSSGPRMRANKATRFLDYDVEIRRSSARLIEPSEPGALSDRPGRAEMSLPGHPLPGPHRARQDPLGAALEVRRQRLRCHLRRPYRPQRHQLKPITISDTITASIPLIGHSLRVGSVGVDKVAFTSDTSYHADWIHNRHGGADPILMRGPVA